MTAITAFRWLFRLTTATLVLVGVALLLVYYIVSRSLPDYDRSVPVAGLEMPISILRTNTNVPHIFSETDAGVYRGLGYAHAEDRLWQMIMFRRTVQGRLAEMFGADVATIDELLRRLDLYGAAIASVEDQSPEGRVALEAYAAGVNDRLQEINRGALGRGAPELFLFTPAIAPWQPADTLAIIKLMGLQLSGHLEEEVLRARTSLVLEDARLRDVLPDVPGSALAALPDYASLVPDVPRYAASDYARGWLSPFPDRGLAGASNAWAAGPTRSASGGTLLANDPHLEFSAPSIWYLARLELESGGIIGGTIPGIPIVLSGRSNVLGWGVTSSFLDDQDVYVEELNPDNPDEYRTPEGYKPFRTQQSILTIKDQDPRTLTLRWTDNGPVIPGSLYNLAAVTPPGHVTSLAWTVLNRNDTTFSASIRFQNAQTIEDAIAAMEGYIAPSQNVTLVAGDRIAMKTIGAMPARDLAHQSQGRLPTQGWRSENRWSGRLDYSENPTFINPPGGIVGNTNNKMTSAPFPFHVSHVWIDSQRVLRWRRLMQGRKVHTRESFIEAQLDAVSPTAQTLLPLIGADLWFTGQAAPEGTPDRQRQIALELLANWNGEMNEHLPEPLIYSAWLRALQDRLIRDDLGPLSAEFTHVQPLFLERVYRDIGGASVWCDVIQSAIEETCTDLAEAALDDAIVWLDETYGVALESLRWGDAHEATHDHQVLGQIPGLRWFVNIRQSTSGGDNTLLRGKTSGTGRNPFYNVHGAGYRGVYDMADPDSSLFVISTGQSGHFLSRHYDDLGELWRRGEYVPMSLDVDLARAASVGVTQLIPAEQ